MNTKYTGGEAAFQSPYPSNSINGIQTNSKSAEFKIILVGNSGVGKTCIVGRASKDTFQEANPTIGFAFQKLHKQIEDQKLTLFIWDTAGFLKETFEGAKQLVIELKRNEHLYDSHFILVGNKTDLEDQREVPKQLAKEYANSQDLEFFEVSAKNGNEVHELFEQLAKVMIKKHFQHIQRKMQQQNMSRNIVIRDNQNSNNQDDVDRCGGANLNSRQHSQVDITLDDLKPLSYKTNLDIKQISTEVGKGWYEVKMSGKLPERRSYQVSCIYNEYLYVFGGQDLKEGAYNTLWRLPIQKIMEGGTTSWEQVTNASGSAPKPIAHHSGFIHKDNFYIYGGLIESDSNPNIYVLNLKTLNWTIFDQSTLQQVPPARDDHSSCYNLEEGFFYIYGGYVNGGKANDLWKWNIDKNEWHQLDQGDFMISDLKYLQLHRNEKPVPRIGASLTYFQGNLYLFGGHDESNEKLEDFWKFDLIRNQWVLIQAKGQLPSGRNGHSIVLINNKIVLFGGILEVTKESDEVFIYDITQNYWSIYESPIYYGSNASPINFKDTDSLHDDKMSSSGHRKKLKHTSSLPQLHGQSELQRSHSKFAPQNYQQQSQLESTFATAGKRNSQPSSLTRKPTNTVAGDQQFVKYMRGQDVLSSPTSIQMKNAFILKNSNYSFEQYFQTMKKRRHLKNGMSINMSISLDNTTGKSSHIQKNKPSARDGHSSFVFHNKMFIFGGDRHHMPFNDLFFLDLDF